MNINDLSFAPPIFKGTFIGSKHWGEVRARMDAKPDHVISGPVDFSDRTEKGGELHYPMYHVKPCCNSISISLACLIMPGLITLFVMQQFPVISTLPVEYQYTILAVGCASYLSLSIAYNASRIAGIAVYLLFHIPYDILWNKKKVGDTLLSHGEQMVKQTALSIQNIVRGPFYALLYNVGHLYTLISPLNGRKLCAKVEAAWNHDIPLIKSFSLAGCAHEGAVLEGNGTLEKLGESSFYLTMCYQPKAWVIYGKNEDGSRGDFLRVESAVEKNVTWNQGLGQGDYPRTRPCLPSGC